MSDASLQQRVWAYFEAEGSTRSAALLRAGLAGLVWVRYGYELLLYNDLGPEGLALSLTFWLASTMMFVGLWSRFSAALLGACLAWMYYVVGLDTRESWTHHHTYLLDFSVLLCALLPCGRSLSVDRWLSLRRAEAAGEAAPAERGPTYAFGLVALLVSVVYLFSAYDKLSWGFLSGDRLASILVWKYFGSDYPQHWIMPPLMTVSAVFTVALELALGVGLWFRRSRPWLILAGAGLHLAFYAILPVSVFSANMVLLYLAFIPPDDFDRWCAWMLGEGQR